MRLIIYIVYRNKPIVRITNTYKFLIVLSIKKRYDSRDFHKKLILDYIISSKSNSVVLQQLFYPYIEKHNHDKINHLSFFECLYCNSPNVK